MADYWISQQKHWCKYCKKFVANNKPSIQLHETGQAHKNQVERFLRNVYKKGREDKEQAESIRREIQRIEQAAMVTAGMKDGVKYMSGATITSTLPKATTSTANRPSRTGGVAGSYGCAANYYVPTIEELRNPSAKDQTSAAQGREEWAINKEIAKVGEWEVVTPVAAPTSSSSNKTRKDDHQTTTHDQAPEFQDDDDDHSVEDLNSFKIKEKEYPDEAYHHHHQEVHEEVVFKKRKLADSDKSRKKKTLRKKE